MKAQLKIIGVTMWLLLAGSLALPAQAGPPAQEPSPQAIFDNMRTQAGGELEIDWAEDTGVPRFLRGRIPTQVTAAADSEAVARNFFRSYAGLYQMQNPDAELAGMETVRDKLDMTHVRFRQEVGGVPVWGAEIVVHLDPGGQITVVNGEYLPNLSVDVTPTLSMAEALTLARSDLGDAAAEFRADRSELTIYARHGHPPTLTWKINVFSPNPLGNWLYFIDAHTGAVVHRLNQLDTAKSLQTYDANNSIFLPGILVCTNSDGTCPGGDTDEQAAHRNAGITYDYYFNSFGRDSYNGFGATLISSVHYSSLYNNAFWNGTQMVYGDGDGTTFSGFARALDVVGHELTHAVTENEANLIYEDQSGALNESYSDVFGTLIEFFGDAANADWLNGEDIYTPSIAGDALRDISNPSSGAAGLWNPAAPFGDGQPDHTSLYAYLPLDLDNGGVHINSGIPNKAAYLISEGGVFHGLSVTGIGRSNLAQIYYRTLTLYLTPSSNFIDARNASIQACVDLFGSAHANCASVQNGFAAVGVGASTSMTNRVYLPLVTKGSICSPTGIYGRVTRKGAAAAGVSLLLRLCPSNGSCSTQRTATTNSNGCYNFSGASSLPSSDYYYYVRYQNPSPTYNNRLYAWLADSITSYTAGANAYGGNFDIADVALGPPASSSPAPLPRTFSWTIRSASELYQWELFAFNNFSPYFASTPEYGRSNYTLTSLPPGFGTFVLYGWDVLVYTADGFGIAYSTNLVKFSTTSLLSEAPSGQATNIPTWQVRDLDDFEARRDRNEK